MSQTLLRQITLVAVLAVILSACQADAVTLTPTPALPAPTGQPPAPQPYSQPHPSLSDVRVREAIADCTNKIELIQSVYPWFDQPTRIEAESIVPRDHWAYTGDDPNFTHHPFNPKLGQALLDESGWTLSPDSAYRTNANGDVLSLKLTTTSAVFRQTWTAKFAQQMKACGILILPFYVPPDWLFGKTSGLQRRDFEVAAFAWVLSPYFDIQSIYPCDQIPTLANQWSGENYNGWCDPQVNQALATAAYYPEAESGQAAYRLIQQKFSAQVPGVPLFERLMVYAINPQLQNFVPDPAEWYSWNAAQWQVPGQDTLTIIQSTEPASLLPANTDYGAAVLEALVYGLDYTALNYQYQPSLLASLPSEAAGTVLVNTVQVKQGTEIVDINNEAITLGPGVTVYNANDQAEAFNGPVSLKQLTVTYEFKPDLAWANGATVAKEDYKLAYALTCQTGTAMSAYPDINYSCDKIQSVNFLSDSAYAVTWKPGFLSPIYKLPPFGRLPDQWVLKDGRQLRDIPVDEWPALPELTQTPLGVGPYRVAEWKAGDFIRFEPNPYYAGPAPLTPNIIVKFVNSSDKALALLKSGQADIIDPESFDVTTATPGLLEAQSHGLAKVIILPSNIYEHLDFNFNAP